MTVRRVAVGKMGALVFLLGIAAFLLGFIDADFAPFALASLGGGGVLAVLLFSRNRQASHPTISHLAPGADENEPIRPR